MSNNGLKIKKIIICVCSITLIVIVLVILLGSFIEKTKYTVIDNFDDYYYNVSEKTKKIIFANLKDTISNNTSQDVPNSGALVRDTEPYLYNYNAKYNGHLGEFVVDIPSVQQSYLIKFNSDDGSISSLGGYTVLIYCLSEDKMIYPDFDCKDNLPFVTEESEENNGSK